MMRVAALYDIHGNLLALPSEGTMLEVFARFELRP